FFPAIVLGLRDSGIECGVSDYDRSKLGKCTDAAMEEAKFANLGCGISFQSLGRQFCAHGRPALHYGIEIDDPLGGTKIRCSANWTQNRVFCRARRQEGTDPSGLTASLRPPDHRSPLLFS